MNRITGGALLLVAATAVAAAVAGCGSDDAPTSESVELDGTSWDATNVEGHDLAGTLTITFDDGRLSILGGCNTINGSYSLDGSSLTAGPLASTMMACPEPLMAQDAWITELLEAGVEVSLADDVLRMSHDGTTITLEPAIA